MSERKHYVLNTILMAGASGVALTPTFPALNYLVWGSGDYLIWGSGNNIAWGTS